MGCDMFLYLYGTETSSPIIMEVLAWNFGIGSSTRAIARDSSLFPEPLNKWTIDQVSQWLCSPKVNLPSLVSTFKEAGVDGEVLSTLTQRDITGLGVTKLGDAKKLLLRISELSTKPKSRRLFRYDDEFEGSIASDDKVFFNSICIWYFLLITVSLSSLTSVLPLGHVLWQ